MVSLMQLIFRVLERLRSKRVTANPKKTSLGLDKVEYVGHLISSEGISFTPEKRKEVLDFPLPSTQKALLQFIGLVNYLRDHVPNMTEKVHPLRALVNMKKYKGSNRVEWNEETIEAFECCRAAVSNVVFLRGHFYTNSTNKCLRLWYWWLPIHGHQWYCETD